MPTLKELGVAALSVLHNYKTMRVERVEGIRNAALRRLAEVAHADMPGVDLIIRDLRPSDLSGYTTDIYAETTTAAAAGYANTAGGDNTVIADETFLAIWGVRLHTAQSSETTATTFQDLQAPISGLRISVGASVVAIWDLYRIMTVVLNDMAESSAYEPVLGITEMPIIVRQNQALKIEEYAVRTVADPYNFSFEGAVCEKAGKNIAT